MDGDPGPWMAARKPQMRTSGARPARAAIAGAASLVLHLLFLTAMVLGLRVIKPLPEPPSIELRILPPFTIAAAPRVVGRPAKKERPPPQPALKPHLTPQPRTAQTPPLTLATRPAEPHKERAGPLLPEEGDAPKGMRPSITGRLGCDDPISFHLTEAQKARCESNVGQLAKTAPRLDLDIDDAKLRAYDRAVRCHANRTGAMPSSAAGEGSSKGLGAVPSLKDCPPGDR